MAQWLRICLPMQGTWGRALLWEDPTCRGAAKPSPQLLSLRSRAREPQLPSPRATTTEARAPGARAPQREATSMRSPHAATRSSPRSLQLEKACAQQRRPKAAKNRK